MKAFLVLAALTSVLVAIAAPWAAPRVAALLLGSVAVVYVSAGIARVARNVGRADERMLVSLQRGETGMPTDLYRLTVDINSSKALRYVNPIVAESLYELAAVRLREHHGVDVRDASSHPALRPLVSDELWMVLTQQRPHQPRFRAKTVRGLRYRSLPTLIAEVERL